MKLKRLAGFLKQNKILRLRKNFTLYLLLLVPLGFVLVFNYYPMYGAQIAFRNFKPVQGIWGSPWVGLDNFERFISNPQFKVSFRNTLYMSLYSFLAFPVPLLLALMVHNAPRRWFRKSVQMVTYIPHFISTVVICGMILQFFSLRFGMVNGFLGLLGIDSVDFLGDPKKFVPLYIWTSTWQGMGFSSIIYISALSGVSQELHEAAVIDGASLLKRVWYIDLPSVTPIIVVMLVLKAGSLLNDSTERILLLQNTMNLSASEVVGTYVYKQGLYAQLPQYSYASAVGLSISAINLFTLALVNKAAKWLTDTSLW